MWSPFKRRQSGESFLRGKGSGGHCVFEGMRLTPNQRPCFLGLTALQATVKKVVPCLAGGQNMMIK